MCGKPRQPAAAGYPGRINRCHVHALEQDGGRAERRVMRSGKTRDAMVAWMIGESGRLAWRIRLVVAKLERRRARTSLRQRRESAKDDQQALRGYGICNDDGDQRSPESLRLAELDHP